jgi:hypothetical protein
MPIHEADPWRTQYFEAIACPPQVHIPTDDALAYELHPQHRWVYNKLLVAQSQGLACGTHTATPPHFPVFSKPITNLRGMGLGSRVLYNAAEFDDLPADENCFWSTHLTGWHVSTDWAVIQGEPVWCRHVRGVPGSGGTFDYWIVEAGRREPMEYYCRRWIRTYLPGYTGMVNLETIGGRIIEAHLRFADQWPDLYGARWTESVVNLYGRGLWNFEDRERREGYSVVLFGPHGRHYEHPRARLLREYRAVADVKSVQITFFQDLPPQAHAMPPGGFRLAVINCVRLSAGLALRARMARDFGLGTKRGEVRGGARAS